jgi:vacuolar protein sorting-associated protein 13A/C
MSLYEAFLLQILHPCSISLAGSTPDGQGLHLDVCMTDIRLRVSPGKYKYVAYICVAVIVLLSWWMMKLSGENISGHEVIHDYSNFWAEVSLKPQNKLYNFGFQE